MKIRTRKKLVRNCAPGQLRDATTGRCGPGIGVDIPRHQMPQIKTDDLEEFLRWVKTQGVPVSGDIVAAHDLSPTQKEFRQERVDAIPDVGRGVSLPILISQDDYILDGTHRWVKAWQRDKEATVKVLRISLPLHDALELMRKFPRVKFVANQSFPRSDKPRYKKGKLVRNAPKKSIKSFRPNRLDPSRTFALRKAFSVELRRRFGRLKAAILKLVGQENALGFVSNSSTIINASSSALQLADFVRLPDDVKGTNCSNCLYEEDGNCTHPKLTPLTVTSRHCCGYWDADGTERNWDAPGTSRPRHVENEFNPDQPRDELGKFVSLYHGTTPERATKIREEGYLEAGGAFAGHSYEEGARIYLTKNPEYAKSYGSEVFEVKVREDEVEPMNWTETEDYEDEEEREQAEYAAEFTYKKQRLPISNAFNPDQPRDERGRFGHAVGWVADKLSQRFASLESRYGRRGAIAVMAGVIALTPVPIPGSSFLPLGIAEGVRLAARMMTRNHDLDGLCVEAAAILKELGVKAEDVDHERLRRIVGASLDPTNNRRWEFHTDARKLEEFQEWLRTQYQEAGVTDEELWKRYIEAGFKKGAGRAFEDTTGAKRAGSGKSEDFYEGGREAFLSSSFARPVSRERVELLASRAYDELDNVTEDMGNKMARVLADGMTTGAGPREVAKDLAEQVDVGRDRAELIARTEIIRAHSEGQLNSMEAMGVEEVGVQVEFLATDDDRICPECAALEGTVYAIEDAHGVIPIHPNCRCAFVPMVPVPTKNSRRVVNAFCPTGPGGGQDNSCGGGGRFAITREGKFYVLRDAKYGSEDHYKERATAEAEQSRREADADARTKAASVPTAPPTVPQAHTADVKALQSAVKALGGEHVTLADLHDHLGWDKGKFNATVKALDGIDGHYLIAQEGYGGISDRERAAHVDGKGAIMVANRSFFADCERDEKGRCLPAGESGIRVSDTTLAKVQAQARAKYASASKPTKEDIEFAKMGIAKKGMAKFRKDHLVGNKAARQQRREALLKEFGDGKTCPCCYCGTKLGEGGKALEQDKLYTTHEGGKYTTRSKDGKMVGNLIPSCSDCNKRRGDVKFKDIEWAT